MVLGVLGVFLGNFNLENLTDQGAVAEIGDNATTWDELFRASYYFFIFGVTV